MTHSNISIPGHDHDNREGKPQTQHMKTTHTVADVSPPLTSRHCPPLLREDGRRQGHPWLLLRRPTPNKIIIIVVMLFTKQEEGSTAAE